MLTLATLVPLLLAWVRWLTSRRRGQQSSRRTRRSRATTNVPTSLPYRAHRKPDWAVPALIELAAHTPEPLATARKLKARFNRRFASRGVTVSHDWVWKQITRHAQAISDRRRQWRARGQGLPPVNDDAWALDLTQLRARPGHGVTILGLVDQGSRALIDLRALQSKTSIAILRVLLDACERHGTPRALRTDNEAMFTSALFRYAMLWLGIRHRRTEPGSPWQNGRIERFFGTLKREMEAVVPEGLFDLSARLVWFGRYYNQQRPHMALRGRTPAEAWREGSRARCTGSG